MRRWRCNADEPRTMPIFPLDHAERHAMDEEVHARPPETVPSPSRASYIVVLTDGDDRGRERAHLEALCRRHAMPMAPPNATHHRVSLGGVRLKWERHGEFSGYLLVAPGAAARPFAEPAAAFLPAHWLAAVPGRTIAAVHVDLVAESAVGIEVAALAGHFGGHGVAGSNIADGAASVFTDLRLHDDGFSRWLVLDRGLTPDQAGRTLQRLVEIEAYRTLALLALPIARRQTPRMLQIERDLAALTDGLAQGKGDDEGLLHELTRMAAEVESGLAASQFRFGACRAYFELVTRRLTELREARLPGLQTIDEFMARRFTPAVATCHTAALRLHGLSERIARASALLSTRVDITRERQNQALLASMDRRAKLQLRLQQTVEGLSVAAIVYYLAGLVGYLAKGIKASGWRFEPDLIVGIAVPALAVLAFLVVRRARRHAAEREPANEN
jgi:uncharacterized membrane-anchored protein